MLTTKALTPASSILITVSFKRMLAEHVVPVTLADVEVTCGLHEDSDPECPDPHPENRLSGDPIIATPYASQRISGNGGVIGAHYVVRFTGIYSDGQREPVDVLVPMKRYADE